MTVAAGLAVVAPILFVGGAFARAAETSSGPLEHLSVQSFDPSGQPTGPGGDPLPTTTTTVPGAPSGGGADGGSLSQSASVAASPGVSEGSSLSLHQIISVSITPGPLTVSPTSEQVSFTNMGPLVHTIPLYGGDLAPVTVVDARGSLVGWHATVSLQAVVGLAGDGAARTRLCVDPGTPTMVAGNPNDVVRGDHRACGRLGDPIPLFFAAPNGGGGTYRDTAHLTLVVPGDLHPDQVTASLAVAVH